MRSSQAYLFLLVAQLGFALVRPCTEVKSLSEINAAIASVGSGVVDLCSFSLNWNNEDPAQCDGPIQIEKNAVITLQCNVGDPNKHFRCAIHCPGRHIIVKKFASLTLTSTGAAAVHKFDWAFNGATQEAISFRGNQLTVNDALFQDSTGDGAIVSLQGGNINLNTCRFENNMNTVAGGALRVESGGSVSISNSRFSDNSAVYGGAIYMNNGALTVTNTIFMRNVASDASGGGAIFHQGDGSAGIDFTATGSGFWDNKATTAVGNMGRGGAIALSGLKSATIDTCKLGKNKVDKYGSAIYSDDVESLQLNGSILSFNTQDVKNRRNLREDEGAGRRLQTITRGGAVYVMTSQTVVVDGSKIYQNTAANGGGLAFIDCPDVTIQGDTSVRGNLANRDAGGMFFGNSVATLTGNTNMSGNNANKGLGDAILVNGGSLTICDVSDNIQAGGVHEETAGVIVPCPLAA